jgi:hypothetical protein
VESLVARLLLGAAHGTDLRVDEGHTRDDVVAGDVGGVPAGDDVPTKPALVLADVIPSAGGVDNVHHGAAEGRPLT